MNKGHEKAYDYILANEAYISCRNDGVVDFHSEEDFKIFQGV